jgi:hypothetical protein
MSYGNGGSYGTVTSPMTGPVQSRESLTSRLDACSGALHGVITELESRLGAVLSAQPPTAEAANKTAMSPMAELVGRVEYAIQRLQSIHGRLEL